MSIQLSSLAALADHIRAAPRQNDRRLVAMAGAPGSGKSTLAASVARYLTEQGTPAQVIPMDGFHLDNRLLKQMDLMNKKGSPETFDAQGFVRLVAGLGAGGIVYYPLFDRSRDLAIAGAGKLDAGCDTVIVEGNYVLLDAPGWRDLSAFWDIRVNLTVPEPVLRQRLVDRWVKAGLPKEEAVARAEGNDLVNAARIRSNVLPCDVTFENNGSLA